MSGMMHCLHTHTKVTGLVEIRQRALRSPLNEWILWAEWTKASLLVYLGLGLRLGLIGRFTLEWLEVPLFCDWVVTLNSHLSMVHSVRSYLYFAQKWRERKWWYVQTILIQRYVYSSIQYRSCPGTIRQHYWPTRHGTRSTVQETQQRKY